MLLKLLFFSRFERTGFLGDILHLKQSVTLSKDLVISQDAAIALLERG